MNSKIKLEKDQHAHTVFFICPSCASRLLHIENIPRDYNNAINLIFLLQWKGCVWKIHVLLHWILWKARHTFVKWEILKQTLSPLLVYCHNTVLVDSMPPLIVRCVLIATWNNVKMIYKMWRENSDWFLHGACHSFVNITTTEPQAVCVIHCVCQCKKKKKRITKVVSFPKLLDAPILKANDV